MSRTSRKFFTRSRQCSYRSMDFAGQRAYENARADLKEVGVHIPKYPCPNAWDDLNPNMWDELPTKFWKRDDMEEWMREWATKRRSPHKGGESIKAWAKGSAWLNPPPNGVD
jgi:hypothetical protein